MAMNSMKESVRKKLMESQQAQFEHLIDRADDLVVIVNPDYSIIDLNNAAEQFYQCKREAVIGRNLFEIAVEEEWQLPASLLTHRRSIKRISWSVVSLPPRYGQKGYMLTGQVISKSVNASQIFLENILYNIPQYILWKDRNFVYLGCNHNFAKLVGFETPESIIGKTDFDLWRSQGANSIRPTDVEVLEGKQLVDVEQSLSLPNGKEGVFLISKVPLRDERNEIIGILVVGTDITERKQNEQKLIEAKLQAELSDRAKSEFIANISHDLRTPINGILGIAQIFNMHEHTKKQEPLINDLSASANLLLGLVEDILDFARLEVGKLELKYSTFNLRQLVTFLVKTFSFQTQQKQIKINVYYDASLPDSIVSEPNYIRRIFLNLIGNAVKFTEKGQIDVTVNLEGNKPAILKILVKDTGIGIPKDKLNAIFDRFSRATPVYSSRYEGLGLGLSIIKRLLDNLGGEVHVSSIENEGSTFTLTIPCEIASLQSPREKEETQALDEGQRLKILKERKVRVLLIEDDKLSQNIEKIFLEEFGCKVDTASNAEEALVKFNESYELICTDIGLPDKDGYALVREIRQMANSHKPVPILAMTAHVFDREKNKCLEAGMNGFINKPVTVEEIRRALLDYLF
ncbi:PAS domain-containing protein [Coxiella burnetii]|uniref:PAS domain-containing protein n=1 Tax=Coxiella burnetii TaxID=777 RepID=UPI0021B03B03|nr:PAS domain-containing protein [Coxiella burnetii]